MISFLQGCVEAALHFRGSQYTLLTRYKSNSNRIPDHTFPPRLHTYLYYVEQCACSIKAFQVRGVISLRKISHMGIRTDHD
jgi:hypothetical protein